MNTFAPISSIMSTNLITVAPTDTLLEVKYILSRFKIHHVPVVEDGMLVGIVSKSDMLGYTTGFAVEEENVAHVNQRLIELKASDIMTSRMAKVEADDRINVAIDVFCLNRFHALPVVEGKKLVGIVTPFDILRVLNAEKPEHPEDIYPV